MDAGVLEIVDPKSFAAAVADEIVASVTESIHDHGVCSIALAGGGTPSGIYRVLARPPRVSEIEWAQVHIFWGDERWFDIQDNRSNYRMAHETLLSQISIPEENVHRVKTELPSAEDGAADYERQIKEIVTVDDEGIPIFDLILLGVGEDGHTASIFPGDRQILSAPGMCAAVKNPASEEERITLLPRVIARARQILFLVSGGDKAEIISRVLEGGEQPELPAQIYRQAEGRVTWFIDSAAAKHLQR
jgi:6-phosphogluconolactonase